MTEFEVRVSQLREAWQRAAEDLGVRVETDNPLIVDAEGHHHPLVALVHDFGGGMHVFEEADDALAQLASQRGHGYTVLASGYDVYDRATFTETLSDWGWTGDGSAPEWYVEQAADQ